MLIFLLIYSRYVDISIDPASIEGFVYIDQDENDFYNISSDEILKEVDINIIEISEIDPNTGQPLIIGEFMNLKTASNYWRVYEFENR